MKGNKVVVTGLGAVTPLGLDVATSWQGICAGASGVADIDQFDASAFTTRFSASVKSFSVEGYLDSRDARRMDPFIQYGMVAGIQANFSRNWVSYRVDKDKVLVLLLRQFVQKIELEKYNSKVVCLGL